MLVDTETSYNILIGRPFLNNLGVIISTPHLAVKFHADNRRMSQEVVALHLD